METIGEKIIGLNTCRTCGYSEDLPHQLMDCFRGLVRCRYDWGKSSLVYPIGFEQMAYPAELCFPYRFLPVAGMCLAHSTEIEKDLYREEFSPEEEAATAKGRQGIFELALERGD